MSTEAMRKETYLRRNYGEARYTPPDIAATNPGIHAVSLLSATASLWVAFIAMIFLKGNVLPIIVIPFAAYYFTAWKMEESDAEEAE